jgi:UDP-3-O-[3-hydroxymyristoyl] glucosamine N-acyltransferase
MPPFIPPRALVDPGVTEGDGTRIWAFAHLAKGDVVGTDCNIFDHTFIKGNIWVGNGVVKRMVHLWDEVIVNDNLYIGQYAMFGAWF